MCNHSHDHSHYTSPEIVQIMPVTAPLFAVYQSPSPPPVAVETGKSDISLVPVLFMGLIRHGEKSMVEGFFAFGAIQSCEDIDGFKGYAASLEAAEKLYA
ncbi:MAG TPA: hypothetical protein VK885_11875 [Desulfotignum sp.]|jgi:hypothetical protein|nr:hypothetical protein [Desulfotignum sp.]